MLILNTFFLRPAHQTEFGNLVHQKQKKNRTDTAKKLKMASATNSFIILLLVSSVLFTVANAGNSGHMPSPSCISCNDKCDHCPDLGKNGARLGAACIGCCQNCHSGSHVSLSLFTFHSNYGNISIYLYKILANCMIGMRKRGPRTICGAHIPNHNEQRKMIP